VNAARSFRAGSLLAALALAGCAGVSSHVAKELPAPRTVAVAPVGGSADLGARELARSLLCARLEERGFDVVAAEYVDHVLSERGWLRDPEAFDRAALPVGEAAAALGVDAVLCADSLDRAGINLLLYRRQSISGTARLLGKDGAEWWSATYTASATGGFVLRSGQVITELRAQGEHGTPMATIALIDAWVESVAETVPRQERPGAPTAPGLPLALGDVHVTSEPSPVAGQRRIVVQARAHPQALVEFDFAGTRGVPMVRAGDASGNTFANTFVGAIDVPGPPGPLAVTVHARSPYGQSESADGRLQ
jgi:hypothetical protein